MAKHSMSDHEKLQLRLADDCAREECLISENCLSEFKPSLEALRYLSNNDVRPLKKVRVKNIFGKDWKTDFLRNTLN